MTDKNGVELKTGQIVEIAGAYFKNDNGLWFIAHSPGDPCWTGSDYSLHRVAKSGRPSTAKDNLGFWPICIFTNDRTKRVEGNAWNKEHATIEVKSGIKTDGIKAIDTIKAKGFQLVSCRKLYPFNTERNQHNFDLIHNICANAMHDMDTGEVPYDAAEYDRLAETREKAERLFCLPLPVAWVPWEVLKDAKELATAAVLHRQDACIAAGRPDLVPYC